MDASGNLIINNSHQLQLISYNSTTLGSSYVLGNAIDLSETGRVSVGTPASYSGMWSSLGFIPIGTADLGKFQGNGFTGTLNGQNYTISGLTIRRPSSDYVGLIGYSDASTATLSNIVLASANVAGNYGVGGLIGYMTAGTITNATVSVSVSAYNQYAGGLVGYLGGGTITNATVSGQVSGTASFVGGLGGYVSATLSNSSSSAVTNGGTVVGGLVGQYAGTASNISATGAVSSGDYSGGLFGQVSGTIDGGTATGAVSGGSYVGGLAGQSSASITNS